MKNRAFTLVEMMVAMAVTAVLVVLLVNVTGTVSNAWKRGESQAESGSNARGALGMMSREMKSALIDLDLGFRIMRVEGEENNFKLKFLTRAEPEADGTPAVRKVCYQLAWADENLIPRVYPTYSEDHPQPVLIRTESKFMEDVFVIDATNTAESWTLTFGELEEGGVLTGEQTNPAQGTTEVVADYVLGWQIIPQYWDEAALATKTDDPRTGSRFFDKFLTSDKSPRGIEVKMAVYPSNQLGPVSSFKSEWSGLRNSRDLFNLHTMPPGNDIFENQLRQHTKFYASTIYLQSKTP